MTREHPFGEWGFLIGDDILEHLPKTVVISLLGGMSTYLESVVAMLEESCDQHPQLLGDLITAQEQFMVISNAYDKLRHGGDHADEVVNS